MFFFFFFHELLTAEAGEVFMCFIHSNASSDATHEKKPLRRDLHGNIIQLYIEMLVVEKIYN